MTIKQDIDRMIDQFPDVKIINVDCSTRGGYRVFGGKFYRDRLLQFVGASRATKRRQEAEREAAFKAAQKDAFEQPASESHQ
jgi:hypothetical protein